LVLDPFPDPEPREEIKILFSSILDVVAVLPIILIVFNKVVVIPALPYGVVAV